MSKSALTGTPPATQDDLYIVKGLMDIFGIPGDPKKGFAFPPAPPPHRSYDDKGPRVIVGVVAAMAITIFITGARIIARYTHRASRLGWDDALIVLAAAFAVAWLGLVIAMITKGGSGKHIYNITYENYNLWWMYGNTDATIFFVTVSITKLSIICFNWRLTGETSRAWQWTHRVFFVVILGYLLTTIFATTFVCNPPQAARDLIVWGQNAGHVKCLNVNTLEISLSGLHIAFDWMLLAIPMIVVFQVSIPLARKLRAVIPLSVGAMSCVSSIVRLNRQLHPPIDITYNWTPQLAWTIVDLVTAVVVTSLPAVNALITTHLPRSLRHYWGSRDNVDEFGRPFNDGYYFETNQRRKTQLLRHGRWGEFFGKQNPNVEKYPRRNANPTIRSCPNTGTRTTIATEQERPPRHHGDHAAFAKFIGRGGKSDQSNSAERKISDPYPIPDDEMDLEELNHPPRSKAHPIKVIGRSTSPTAGEYHAQ